jgi:hypothetical protein
MLAIRMGVFIEELTFDHVSVSPEPTPIECKGMIPTEKLNGKDARLQKN